MICQSVLKYASCSILPHPLAFQFRNVSQVTIFRERHCKGIIFLQGATEIVPGQTLTLSPTDPEYTAMLPTLSTPSIPAHLSFCSEPRTPLPHLLLSRRHGQKPLAIKDPQPTLWHRKSLQSNYSTSALIVRTIYSLGAFAADQREDRRRAACAFVRHRKYVTVHPTHCQALQIRFSHQCDRRGKTNIVPSCLFRTAGTLELILGLLEIQDFQLSAVYGENKEQHNKAQITCVFLYEFSFKNSYISHFTERSLLVPPGKHKHNFGIHLERIKNREGHLSFY